MNWQSAYNLRPNELTEGVHLGKVIVAVVGFDDWAAYELEVDEMGQTPNAETVARNGDKISQATAEKLFPVCVNAGLKWRA